VIALDVALLPSSVTTAPLTVTRPSTMSCSAWRREATPGLAKGSFAADRGPSALLFHGAAGAGGSGWAISSGAPPQPQGRGSAVSSGAERFRGSAGARVSFRSISRRRIRRISRSFSEGTALVLRPNGSGIPWWFCRGSACRRPFLRPAHDHQLAVERVSPRRALHSANLLDLGHRDRLFIGDHGSVSSAAGRA